MLKKTCFLNLFFGVCFFKGISESYSKTIPLFPLELGGQGQLQKNKYLYP